MITNYRRMQDWIGIVEGGYVNHKNDPGGPTDRGITQRTFDAWNRLQGLPIRPVKGITRETAEAIIASQYFAPVRADLLPSGLDYAVADFAVNSGPATAVKYLQMIVGVTQDGIMGNQTLAAISARPVEDLIVSLCEVRMRFLRGLSTWSTFGNGWRRRVMGEITGVQHNDIGVIDRAVYLARGTGSIPNPSRLDDGASAKAPSDSTSARTTIRDALTSRDGIGAVIGSGGLAALSSGDGPVQIALSVVLVVVVLTAAYMLVRKARIT